MMYDSWWCECWRGRDYFDWSIDVLVHNIVVACALTVERNRGWRDGKAYWDREDPYR